MVLLLRHAIKVSELQWIFSDQKHFHLIPVRFRFDFRHNLNFFSFVQPKLADTIKRNANLIFDRGGFIRQMDYLGHNKIPYKMSKNRAPFREAEHMVFKFDVSAQLKDDLKEEIDLDVDVIRCRIYQQHEPREYQCTLEKEMRPVPERDEVKRLLEMQKKAQTKKKPHFLPQMGIDYYPFQR